MVCGSRFANFIRIHFWPSFYREFCIFFSNFVWQLHGEIEYQVPVTEQDRYELIRKVTIKGRVPSPRRPRLQLRGGPVNIYVTVVFLQCALSLGHRSDLRRRLSNYTVRATSGRSPTPTQSSPARKKLGHLRSTVCTLHSPV